MTEVRTSGADHCSGMLYGHSAQMCTPFVDGRPYLAQTAADEDCCPAMQDNKPVYQVQACSQEEVDVAFKAAKDAQRDWAKVQPFQLYGGHVNAPAC